MCQLLLSLVVALMTRLSLPFEEQCSVCLLMLPTQEGSCDCEVTNECALLGRNFQQYNIALYLSCIIFHHFSAVHLLDNFRHLFGCCVFNGVAIRFSCVHLPCLRMLIPFSSQTTTKQRPKKIQALLNV